MKTWWVLAYHQYYPYSGLGNVYECFATEGEALACAEELEKTSSYDWVEVEDISSWL